MTRFSPKSFVCVSLSLVDSSIALSLSILFLCVSSHFHHFKNRTNQKWSSHLFSRSFVFLALIHVFFPSPTIQNTHFSHDHFHLAVEWNLARGAVAVHRNRKVLRFYLDFSNGIIFVCVLNWWIDTDFWKLMCVAAGKMEFFIKNNCFRIQPPIRTLLLSILIKILINKFVCVDGKELTIYWIYECAVQTARKPLTKLISNANSIAHNTFINALNDSQ